MGFVRFLEYVVASVVLIVLIVFSVSNRNQLEINLFPFPFLIEVPIYIALLGVLIIGVVIGGFVVYISNLGVRSTLRSDVRRKRILGDKSHSLKQTRDTPHSPESGS